MFERLFGKKKTIRVTILDADTDGLIGHSDQPVETIPDSFEIDTQMTIRETEYTVVSAEPAFKSEFISSGKLTLRLRKVQYIDPKEVLMTLPTISDSLAPVGNVPFVKESYFNMHEDEWRQTEFVSQSKLPEVEKEFEEISKIYANHSVPISDSSIRAFKELHVRKIINPLNTAGGVVLRYDELKDLLGTAGSLTFSTAGKKPYGFVVNGFSFVHNKSVFYGNVVNGNSVETLGVINPEDVTLLCDTIKERYSLALVDWVNTRFC